MRTVTLAGSAGMIFLLRRRFGFAGHVAAQHALQVQQREGLAAAEAAMRPEVIQPGVLPLGAPDAIPHVILQSSRFIQNQGAGLLAVVVAGDEIVAVVPGEEPLDKNRTSG